jgi:hypothetical protein
MVNVNIRGDLRIAVGVILGGDWLDRRAATEQAVATGTLIAPR